MKNGQEPRRAVFDFEKETPTVPPRRASEEDVKTDTFKDALRARRQEIKDRRSVVLKALRDANSELREIDVELRSVDTELRRIYAE